MRLMSRRLCIAACLLGTLAGCAKPPGPYRKPVIPVKGRVTVDGKAPTSPIKVECQNTGTLDNVHPTVSWGMTGDNGSFAISTYENGDGVPEGDYALTFLWGEMNLVSMSYGGKDKLNRRYVKVADSPAKFTAKEGSPVDLGEIALTTK